MQGLLVPIDPAHPARLRDAVAEAIRIHASEPVAIHLLSVQPPVNSHVAQLFDGDELDELRRHAGAEDLAPARALLDAQQVPYRCVVRIGRGAETIARSARELGCDRIVMGRDDATAGLAGRLFGTLAQQVRHLLAAGSSPCRVIGP